MKHIPNFGEYGFVPITPMTKVPIKALQFQVLISLLTLMILLVLGYMMHQDSKEKNEKALFPLKKEGGNLPMGYNYPR